MGQVHTERYWTDKDKEIIATILTSTTERLIRFQSEAELAVPGTCMDRPDILVHSVPILEPAVGDDLLAVGLRTNPVRETVTDSSKTCGMGDLH